ncbi:RNA-directed DNA polymerase, eukaryota, reverse transcriptase zinc-binding domain protein, partial [Tanacetum coccineum]
MDGIGNMDEQKVHGMMNAESCDIDVCKNANEIAKCTVSDSTNKCSANESGIIDSSKAKSDDAKNAKSSVKITGSNENKYDNKLIQIPTEIDNDRNELVIFNEELLNRWDINMCIAKTEPTKLRIWVKMCNVSLEAWTVKGISDLASRIGNPIIMNVVTTGM